MTVDVGAGPGPLFVTFTATVPLVPGVIAVFEALTARSADGVVTTSVWFGIWLSRLVETAVKSVALAV